MTSGPLVALVLSGDQVIEVVRAMIGSTDGRGAAAGTIRGDLSLSNRENLVHASDSADSAKREGATASPSWPDRRADGPGPLLAGPGPSCVRAIRPAPAAASGRSPRPGSTR